MNYFKFDWNSPVGARTWSILDLCYLSCVLLLLASLPLSRMGGAVDILEYISDAALGGRRDDPEAWLFISGGIFFINKAIDIIDGSCRLRYWRCRLWFYFASIAIVILLLHLLIRVLSLWYNEIKFQSRQGFNKCVWVRWERCECTMWSSSKPQHLFTYSLTENKISWNETLF